MSHIIEMNSILLSNKRIRNSNCFQISRLNTFVRQISCVRLNYNKYFKNVVGSSKNIELFSKANIIDKIDPCYLRAYSPTKGQYLQTSPIKIQ